MRDLCACPGRAGSQSNKADAVRDSESDPPVMSHDHQPHTSAPLSRAHSTTTRSPPRTAFTLIASLYSLRPVFSYRFDILGRPSDWYIKLFLLPAQHTDFPFKFMFVSKLPSRDSSLHPHPTSLRLLPCKHVACPLSDWPSPAHLFPSSSNSGLPYVLTSVGFLCRFTPYLRFPSGQLHPSLDSRSAYFTTGIIVTA